MKSRSFVKGAAVLGAAGLIVKVIGAFYRVPLTRIIGEGGMGVYQMAYPIYIYLLVISTSGIPTAISKMVSEKITLGDASAAKRIFTVSLRILLSLGLITSLLLALGAEKIAAWLGEPLAALSIRCISPALLLSSVTSAYRGYFQGMQDMEPTAFSQLLEQTGKLGIGLYLASRWYEKYSGFGMRAAMMHGAAGAMMGVSLSELAALLFMMGIYRKKKLRLDTMLAQNAAGAEAPFISVGKRLIKIALPVTAGASVIPLIGILDAAIINNSLMALGYSQDAARSLYGILTGMVNSLVHMPAVLTAALSMSLVPSIAGSNARGNLQEVREKARIGIKLTMLIGVPCAIGMFLLARPILSLLYPGLSRPEAGNNLEVACSLLRMLSFSVIFLCLLQTTTGILQGMGKHYVPVVNLLIGAVFKVLFSLLFIAMPRLNIRGAALGSIACCGITGLLNTVCVLRISKTAFSVRRLIGKPLLAGGVMGVVTWGLYGILQRNVSGFSALAVCICASAAVYFAMTVLLRALDEKELRYLPGGKKLKRYFVRCR